MNIEVKSLSCPNCNANNDGGETDTYNIIIDYDIMMIHCTGCQSILAVIPIAMIHGVKYADDDINVNVLLEMILSEMQYITSHSDVVCPVCGHGNNYVIYRYNHDTQEFAYQCDCDCGVTFDAEQPIINTIYIISQWREGDSSNI